MRQESEEPAARARRMPLRETGGSGAQLQSWAAGTDLPPVSTPGGGGGRSAAATEAGDVSAGVLLYDSDHVNNRT